MKKVILFLAILLCFFSFSTVNARVIKSEQRVISIDLMEEADNIEDKESKAGGLELKQDPDIPCRGDDGKGFLSQDAYDLMLEMFNYVRIIAPILLILLTSVDFAYAVISQDNDALKKAEGKIVKRAIATVLIFFVPTIISAIFQLPGIKDSIVSNSDPLCGIK